MESSEIPDLFYALAATQEGKRLFAARASGLYISADSGRRWSYAYQSLLGDQPLPTLATALSPAFERDGVVLGGTPGAIVRSRDGGWHWEVARIGLSSTLVNGLAFSPNFEKDGTAFAATLEDGVFCSYDGGANWLAWNFGLLDANGICLAVSPDFAKDQTVYVGVSSGLFLSRNGGKSWEGVELPMGQVEISALAILPRDDREYTLFAGTSSHGLMQSNDGGKTWAQVEREIPSGPIQYIWVETGANPTLALPNCCGGGEIALLVMVDQMMMLSRGAGEGFRPCLAEELPEDFEITTVCPVSGLKAGDPIYLGGINQMVETHLR